MSNHEFDIDLSQFEEFAEADLLDLVEGTMDPERAMELAHAVKLRDPDLLRRLIRMQADRLELTAHGEPVAPPHLLESVQSRLIREDLLEGDFLETVEPTAMMARAVKDLDRRRRRRMYRGPIMAGLAASVAVIGVTVVLVGWSLLSESNRRGTTLPESVVQNTTEESVSPAAETEEIKRQAVFAARPDESVRTAHVRRVQAMAEPVPPPIPELELADYGLMLKGIQGEDFEPALAELSQKGALVLVRNLTIAESVTEATSPGRASFGARQEGSGGVTNATVQDLQPEPLVGEPSMAPNTQTRLELAERGYRWAVVVDRGVAAEVVEQIGRLADNARLISARSEPSGELDELDAWQTWRSREAAAGQGVGNAKRIIVPIAILEQ